MKRLPFLGLLVCIVVQTGAEDPATRLTYLADESPPASFAHNGQAAGYAVEILEAVWQQMGVPPQPIRIVSWTEGYQAALDTPGTVFFAITRSPQRETRFQWVGPVHNVDHVLVALKANAIVLHSTDYAHQYLTGVVRDDISESLMHVAGFAQNELVVAANWKENFQLLKSGQVQLVCVIEEAVDVFAMNAGIGKQNLEIVGIVATTGDYYAFNKSIDTALVLRFQQAFDSTAPKRRAILSKYGQKMED
jgi:polar amino acid transport system substrate-binding protein